MSTALLNITASAEKAQAADGAILTTEFLESCRELLPIVDKFGMSFAIVRSDIGGNIGRLAAAQAKDPARYSSVFPIITDEVQRGEQEGRQSNTNGLLWLKRACEFILMLLKRLQEDRGVSLAVAANEVYYQTLNKYHTWYTTTAFVLALKLVPSREALFAALGTPGEEMMQQVAATIAVFEPLLLKVQGFLVQHNLDFQTKV